MPGAASPGSRPPPAERILHVDMDAFYASVEALDDPALRGAPLVVGSPGPRGVVMSASYEARRFGVRSAMPSVRARRLCPELVIVPPRFVRYREESDRVLDILFSVTPLVETVSLDEAFLDVSGAGRLFGLPIEIAGRIRARVREERGLACSVGVAPNKLLAKIASRQAKPDGIGVVPADGVRRFLNPLPVDRLWGVGPETTSTLGRLGVRTVGELAVLSADVAARVFGPGPAAHLASLARGADERPVIPYEPAKQVSAEQTFDRDLDAPEEIRRELLRLSDKVASRLRTSGRAARTVTIKVRLANFTTVTRSRTLVAATDVAARVYRASGDMFQDLRLARPRIRLLGVAASGLVDGAGPEQLRLGERPDRWGDADRAVDRARERFGRDAVERAAIARRRPRGARPPTASPQGSSGLPPPGSPAPPGNRESARDARTRRRS
ncbi:MAG: DNA polymerase IV [Acidobacteria bacterium]|nr:DNA polymerase IV [Acidobacteriota bacterium]